MLSEGFAERVPSLSPEQGQGFSVQEEVPSGVRKKLERPEDAGSSTNDVRGYRVESFSPFDQNVYLAAADDWQRETAGLSNSPADLIAWEKVKKSSDRKVREAIALIREEEERTEAERLQAAEAERERARQSSEARAARRAQIEQRQKERSERRMKGWREGNRREVSSTRALDKKLDKKYVDFFTASEQGGADDAEELRWLQAKIGSASGDRKGLRFVRRSEGLIYDGDGEAHQVGSRGQTGDLVSASEDVHKEGLRWLFSETYRPALKVFLRKKYALDFAGLARVRAQVENMYRREVGVEPGSKEKTLIDEKTAELVERFSQEIVERFTNGETDGHVGKEACTRERFQWLQNRLMGVLRGVGALKHVDVSLGALALEHDGADVAYAEVETGEGVSEEKKATLFSRLALRNPEEWGKEFPARLRNMPQFTEHVQASMAELGLLGMLTQDVGGDVSAYDFDLERGRFLQKTTGEVFSVAADFTRELPRDLAPRSEHPSLVKTMVEEALAYRNIPFEIACLHRLPMPAYARKALAQLASQLRDDAQPLTQLIRQSFATAFMNPLLAEKEFTLFADRVVACAKQSSFDPKVSGIVADFAASTQPLVGGASLLGQVPSTEALLDAA